MLFKQALLERIARGEVTVAFRRWKRPTVKPGGRLRTSVGELQIDAVELCHTQDITAADAVAAGFGSLAEALTQLDRQAGGTLYRITFHFDRPDPRTKLCECTRFSKAQFEEIERTLDRMARDETNRTWSYDLIRLISARPGITAGEISTIVGTDKDVLKRKIRKIMELGLTISLPRGYRTSARGDAYLQILAKSG